MTFKLKTLLVTLALATTPALAQSPFCDRMRTAYNNCIVIKTQHYADLKVIAERFSEGQERVRFERSEHIDQSPEDYAVMECASNRAEAWQAGCTE